MARGNRRSYRADGGDCFDGGAAVKLYRTMDESLALCDYLKAKRTDPTPAQQRRARKHWHGTSVLDRVMRIVARRK